MERHIGRDNLLNVRRVEWYHRVLLSYLGGYVKIVAGLLVVALVGDVSFLADGSEERSSISQASTYTSSGRYYEICAYHLSLLFRLQFLM